MTNRSIHESIEQASQVIGKTWPLYSFVTSNPLSGYEKNSFKNAVKQAEFLLEAKVFPDKSFLLEALQKGYIENKILSDLLRENGFLESVDYYKQQLSFIKEKVETINPNNHLDRIFAKWLAAFMDEGLAEWDMPHKKEGFYKAWRKLAIYDNELPKTAIKAIPKTCEEALNELLNGYSQEQITSLFTHHLAALPGWTGYINYRIELNTNWQEAFPITLADYLAVRLWLAKQIGAEILPKNQDKIENTRTSKLQYVWLKAWEKSWQNKLEKLLETEIESSNSHETDKEMPDAQLVFCIDTRSELIRRHVESQGNYETFGYAGFFGIAMDYENPKSGLTIKSCPPIVNSVYQVSETAQYNYSDKFRSYKNKIEVKKFENYFLKRMKNMLPSAFGFVEGSGFFYGLALIARTLTPRFLYRVNKKSAFNIESICNTEIKKSCNDSNAGITLQLEEMVSIVKSGFDLLGWKKFAPLVVFAGHGSHSKNNPFGSSLDCGACAASPGRHNARMLAKLANMPEVKQVLKENYNIHIPDTTIFIGGEHNTTTDEIVLFDAEVPSSHQKSLQKLKANLKKAQQTATQERLGVNENGIALAQIKANSWSETRPEWGLAKNAAFVVGPRALTKNKNLDGRCFLHSYNWEMDTQGKALEAIMQGPMVVTQWINNHYYFSTVDNNLFGSGSKVTQNITGKFGVVQGNGGDLKMGLPLQSLMPSDSEMYHQPLRLTVVIQAPIPRVSDILSRNDNLRNLLDNEWIYLMVMNPLENNTIYHYKNNLNWVSPITSLETVKNSKRMKSENLKEALV